MASGSGEPHSIQTAGKVGGKRHSSGAGVRGSGRLNLEQAVVRTALLLNTTGEVDYGALLETIGESTCADCVYFQMVPADERRLDTLGGGSSAVALILWHQTVADGGGAPKGKIERFESEDLDQEHILEDRLKESDVYAVPVLSAEGRFYGYLGIAHREPSQAWSEDDQRILNVVGDILSSHLERKRAEEALQESEERWRTLIERHPEPILITLKGQVSYINPSGCRLLGIHEAEQVTGRSFYDFVSAEEQDVIQERHRKQIDRTVSEPFRHEIARLDGEWRIVETLAVPIAHQGGEAVQIVIRDLTEREQSEYRYRTFVETISEGIWHVRLSTPVSISAAFDVQQKYIRKYSILADCNRVMAHMLGVSEPEEVEGKNLWEYLPAARCVAEFVRSHHRVRNCQLSVAGANGDTRHYVMNAVGTVERGQLVGLWGSCIDVTENVELERRMVNVLEEQQQQIGRELHDGVGQLLTGVRMLTQVLTETLTEEGNESAELSRKIQRFSDDAALQVRNIYYGLTPAQLSTEGLATALQELAANTDALPNVRCTFNHDEHADVRKLEAKVNLYRIAQEAVNNALKHARATSIAVSLKQDENAMVLLVEDNGIGFEAGGGTSKSLGLKSMHYRARTIGAELTLESSPGQGTRVRCVIPRDTAATAEQD